MKRVARDQNPVVAFALLKLEVIDAEAAIDQAIKGQLQTPGRELSKPEAPRGAGLLLTARGNHTHAELDIVFRNVSIRPVPLREEGILNWKDEVLALLLDLSEGVVKIGLKVRDDESIGRVDR
jgi:hypothetical protein